MREAEIQSKIIARLKEAGWFVTKLITTTTNGIPDLLCIKSGRVIFIEVKSATGKIAPLQAYRIGQIKKQGIEVIVTNNIEGVSHLCRS